MDGGESQHRLEKHPNNRELTENSLQAIKTHRKRAASRSVSLERMSCRRDQLGRKVDPTRIWVRLWSFRRTGIPWSTRSTKMDTATFSLSQTHTLRSVKSTMKVRIGPGSRFLVGFIEYWLRTRFLLHFTIVRRRWKQPKIAWRLPARRDTAWSDALTVSLA